MVGLGQGFRVQRVSVQGGAGAKKGRVGALIYLVFFSLICYK